MKHIFTLALIAFSWMLKANSNPLSPATSAYAQIRVNMYAINPDRSEALVDGTLTQYDSTYSNNVDGGDARKLFNPGENFGMLRGSTILIIEKRHIIEGNDSIFFKMWNMRNITYRLEIVSYHLDQPGRIGLLQDNYLHTSSLLNLSDTTNVNFTVTADAASKAQDRFRIVFITNSYSALPLTFTSFKCHEHNNKVNIDWNTANENKVKNYSVEKSSDGHNFIVSTTLKANNAAINEYNWIDAYPIEGNNYYRISSTDLDGKIEYSSIAKVYIEKRNADIKIYPNPATAENLKLQLINQPPGLYEISLTNSFGQSVMVKSIQHIAGTNVETLSPLPHVSKGIYRLEIKLPSGAKKTINILF